MTAETIIKEQQSAAPQTELPTEAPIGPAPASDDAELDQLLADFDNATSKPAQSEPAPDNTGQDAASSAQLDKLLADFGIPTADQKRIGELEGQIGSLRAAELERQSARDFAGFSAELQKQLGPNLPEDYAKTSLLAAAAQDANLLIAWKYRSLTAEELAQADKEFRELEALHFRVTHSPDTDPRKAQAIQMIEQRGRELGIAMNARAIIMNARRAVIKRAESFKPIDPEATQIHDDVAAWVRGASAKALPEAPVQWGRLSNAEFREKVRREFGFDPVT